MASRRAAFVALVCLVYLADGVTAPGPRYFPAYTEKNKRIMKRLAHLSLVVLFLLSLGSRDLFAQVTATATIQGTVVDKSQAAIVGAQVVARSKDTSFTRTTSTNDAGYYRFELLPIGAYIISITKGGFATTTQTVEVMVGQVITANAELQIGSSSETVEVTSEAPLIDVAKTSVSQNITPSEVEELPLVGRDVANWRISRRA